MKKDAKGRIIRPTYPRATSTIKGVAAALRKVLGSDKVHTGANSDRGPVRMWFPSVCDEINQLISDGRGYPGGRIIECYGPEATVKTGFGYDVIAAVQNVGGTGVLLPTEGNIDYWLADRWGVNTNEWITPEVTTLEEVDATILATLRRVGKKHPIAFVWDSVAGTTTQAELEEENLSQTRAAQIRALLMSKMFRRFGAMFPEYNAILFCINQVRDNPDAMFGDKQKPTGGKALPFYAALRLRLKMTGQVSRQRDGKKKTTGFKIEVYTKKNRLAPPFQKTEVICDFDRGIISLEKPKQRRKKKASKKKTALQRAAAKRKR